MNIIALGVGVVGAFVLGFIVYGPFLGLQRRWAEGTRIDPEPNGMPMGTLLVHLVMLTLYALVIAMTETTNALDVAVVAILAITAQAAAVGAWAQKTGFAIAVDAGYALGCGVVMILAHAAL